jgi:succinate dehydrogenase/fumarate reductase cytochrome b subunit
MFVWVFHRISGILLIIFIGMKFFTGFGLDKQFGQAKVEFFRPIHNNHPLDLILLFLFLFHSLYGMRTIIYDLGVKKERLLFWCATLTGLLLFFVIGFRFYI